MRKNLLQISLLAACLSGILMVEGVEAKHTKICDMADDDKCINDVTAWKTAMMKQHEKDVNEAASKMKEENCSKFPCNFENACESNDYCKKNPLRSLH